MEDQAEIIYRGRLDGKQRNRLKGLLDMMYKPGELAEELGINREQFYRVYIPLGCPHMRDRRGYLEVNGKEFRKWYLENYQKAKVQDDQTFCKTCKKAVSIQEPIQLRKNGLIYIISTCPVCGRKIAKIIDCKKGKHDQ